MLKEIVGLQHHYSVLDSSYKQPAISVLKLIDNVHQDTRKDFQLNLIRQRFYLMVWSRLICN